MVSIRTGEKENCTWGEMLNAVRRIFSKGEMFGDTAGRYEGIFGEEYKKREVITEVVNKNTEVAPVQPVPNLKSEVKKDKKPAQKTEQGEKNAKKNEVKSEIIPLGDNSKNAKLSEEREYAADVETDKQRSTVPVQRQDEAERLEKRKKEIIENIHSAIKKMNAAIDSECWNTAKMHLTDIKLDVEQIEKMEKELEELSDSTQMRLEDYEEEQENKL